MPPRNSDKREFMSLGEVLESASGLNVPTTGTIEQELGRVTIPAKLLRDPLIYGVRYQFIVDGAPNTNAKTVRVRVGSLVGATIMSHAADVSASNSFNFEAELLPLAAGLVGGLGQSARVFGTSFTFVVVPFAVDYDAAIPLLVTGESAAAAGNLILRARRLTTILNR